MPAVIAALYDVHGNLPALDAVLEEISGEGVDRIVVGGDVLPGPLQTLALARLLDSPIPVDFIRGNGEREVLAEHDGATSSLPEKVRDILRWSAREMPPHHEQHIRRWPTTLTLGIEGLGPVLFCHATPRSDSEIFLRTTAEEHVEPAFRGIDADVVVCGHTHMQFERSIGGRHVINAGSVGMPYGRPDACWLLLGRGIELRQTSYDREAAAARIRASSYPMADEFATREILAPMSEHDALALFRRVEMRSLDRSGTQ